MDAFEFSEYWSVTKDVVDSFNKNGGIILKGVLDNEEVSNVLEFVQNSKEIKQHAYSCDDGQEGKSKLAEWNNPGDDITGMVARSKKIAGTFQDLLGDEVYHYHTKLMMKDAEVGGAHSWHQDYGYWYKNGILTPDMGSVFIALDRCTRKNSCLQVLAGSHKMGRIDHKPLTNSSKQGESVQFGADLQRVIWAKQRYPLVHCELEPGDAIFFHSNLLHTSDQNHSRMRRWVLICAYNTKANNPLIEHYHPCYTKLNMVEDKAIKECDITQNSSEDKGWVEPTHRHTTVKN